MEQNLEELTEKIAQRTAELIMQKLFQRCRDEMSVHDICQEFNISRETLRRRIKSGVLSKPRRSRGRNWFSRYEVENADVRGYL